MQNMGVACAPADNNHILSTQRKLSLNQGKNEVGGAEIYPDLYWRGKQDHNCQLSWRTISEEFVNGGQGIMKLRVRHWRMKGEKIDNEAEDSSLKPKSEVLHRDKSQ